LFPYYGANGQAGWIDDYLFVEPLILLAEDGGNFGSMERPIAYAVSGRYWVNNHAHVLKPRDELIDFDYCLQAIRIRPDVAQLVSGSTRAKLNQETPACIPVPLPSLSEQKRIAGILKEQMAAVEAARRSAEAQLQDAEALPAAYLLAVFKSPEAVRWSKKRLGEIGSDEGCFTDGPFGSNLKTEHYSTGGARVVRLQNIGRGEFLDSDKAYVSNEHFDSLQRHHVQPGDVVMAALGDGVRPAGRACKIPEGFGPGLVKADCFRIRLPKEKACPDYLVAVLNSPVSLASIAASLRGAMRLRVTLKILREVEMPLPPLADQHRISAQLSTRMASAERLRQASAEQLDAINKLPAALLRLAFSGEL